MTTIFTIIEKYCWNQKEKYNKMKLMQEVVCNDDEDVKHAA